MNIFARRVINRFDRAVTGKILIRKEVDMKDSVAMARSLGETHGWQERHTTFDHWQFGGGLVLVIWGLSDVRSPSREDCRNNGHEPLSPEPIWPSHRTGFNRWTMGACARAVSATLRQIQASSCVPLHKLDKLLALEKSRPHVVALALGDD
jgi:hypothetical protein